MGNRKRFSQTAILQHFGAVCEECEKGIPEVTLTLHHKDGNAKNDKSENIKILCLGCHRKLEGRDKKKRDYR